MLRSIRNTIDAKKLICRTMSNVVRDKRLESNFKEVRIPVPWGHVAGKWWGPHNRRPILVLHGWQDNCGSFDLLIPRLPDFGYLAIDFPGHGLSSHLPKGAYYHQLDQVVLLNTIIEYLKWPKVTLLGHSMGAVAAFTYSMLFPDKVEFLTLFNAMQPPVFPNRLERTSDDIKNFANKLSKTGEPPSYTLQNITKQLHCGTEKAINLDKCKYILTRGMQPSKQKQDEFYFSRDSRLKFISCLWSREDVLQACKTVKAPIFLYVADESPFYKQWAVTEEYVDLLQKNNCFVVFQKVSGTHYVHLNNAQFVADLVKPFLTRNYSKENHILEKNTLEAIVVQ